MYNYLKLVKVPDRCLTFTEIVQELTECFDIKSNNDATPRALVTYLLSYHETHIGPKLFKFNDNLEYVIKSVYASLDYVKEVFSRIDNMLNDYAVIELVMDGRPYYLHREGEKLTNDLKKNALCIDIEDIL